MLFSVKVFSLSSDKFHDFELENTSQYQMDMETHYEMEPVVSCKNILLENRGYP